MYGYATITCCSCGLCFAVPQAWERDRRRDHLGFHCPNGHPLVFKGKSEEQRLKEQLAERDRQLETQKRLTEKARGSARSYKGKVTAIKNRVANGVCPCCNRTFQNLMRHMQDQHPGWKGADL